MKFEVQQVVEQYERRKRIDPGRYSYLNYEKLLSVQERQRAFVSLLRRQGIKDLSALSILEIGCGSGGNLLELLQLGASPERLTGNELLPDRMQQAARRLPEALRLFEGDASSLEFEAGTFDIVYQSTVFTSLLDARFQERLAACMWQWLKPGGGVLWYDFVYDNPANRDVKGVSINRIRDLFPEGTISARRVTLAPPISRRICRIHPTGYHILNSIPPLRTHVLCWIGKQRHP